MGGYDECRKKLVFPGTIMCSQGFTMTEKSKGNGLQFRAGVKKPPERSEKEERVAVGGSATLETVAISRALPLFIQNAFTNAVRRYN